MKLQVRNSYFKLLAKAGGTKIDDYSFRQEDGFGTIDSNRLTLEDMALLKGIAQKAYDDRKESGAMGLVRRINAWERVQTSVDTAVINNLNALVDAVKVYFKDTPHKWVFKQELDGEMIPYYVVGAVYHEAKPERLEPAHTVLEVASMCRGKKDSKTVVFHRDKLGKTLADLLQNESLYRETPEAVAAFEKECARYSELAGKTGTQFLARGRAFHEHGYYDTRVVEMEIEGELSKVVMDDYGDPEDDEEDNRRGRGSGRRSAEAVVDATFWRKGQQKSKYDEEENPDDVVVLPNQPYVCVFQLEKHRHLTIHVNSIEEYRYNEALVAKLVLPEADKDLIHILTQGADEQMDDIIKGKTGGIIVIATGPPGTGKTLTAEVFSEGVKRPLYSVQCSQLGTSPNGLEKTLKLTLNRAARWGAILLIDEADVYIHERGDDIEQNAIVGVWLRILEYYRGIMFMTSNRDVIIDDAIMSRATAWIKYSYPTREALMDIWKVLSTQYAVTLTLQTIEKLVASKKLKHISGRTVKNLLKLSRLLSRRKKKPVTQEMIEYVSQYLDIEEEEDHARTGTAERPSDVNRKSVHKRKAPACSDETGMVLHVGADA